MGSLFQKAVPASSKLKAGFMGFQGSGKTYTASMLAIGLVKYLRKLERPEAERPVYFLDTETGADYVQRHYDLAGIELRTAKTRAFADLKPAILEAEAEGVVLIIDSVSHYWTEFQEAYTKKHRRRFIQFEDWRYLKQEWNRDFATLYVNSALHCIVCGRAGFEYDYHEREDGKKELEKTGVKMKTEGEFGYEPSLLVLMDRKVDIDTKKVVREAHVLKERFAVIDGKTFAFDPNEKDEDGPLRVFKAFRPHIELLNLGAAHIGVDSTRNSDGIIPDPDNEWKHEAKRREILAEEIAGLMQKHYPGQTAQDKAARAQLMEDIFETRSWTKVESLHSDRLTMGFERLKERLEPTPQSTEDVPA